MTKAFDQFAINHMTTAIGIEMSTSGRGPHPESDTLFIGGTPPSDADEIALGRFGHSKNYKIVYPSFAMDDIASGPVAFHVVVTDGVTECFVLQNGRLWKRDRRSPAVLIFAAIGATISLSAKGQLAVRQTRGITHEHGFEFAREAVAARAASKPGRVPVISPIGGLITVLDMQAFAETFDKAA